jgi:glycosyltransferase involved in cell wall biosynthesis
MENPAKKKLKLLLVSPLPPPAGGIQTVTETMISYLKNNQNGIEISLYDNSHRLRPATSQSLVIRILTGLINSLKTYADVRKFVRQAKPDIIHLSSSSSLALIKDLLIVSFAKREKVRIIMHWHFGRIPQLARKDNWEWKLLRRVIKKSTASVLIDSASYNALYESGFRNIFLVPNPVAQAVEMKMKDRMSLILDSGDEQRSRRRIVFVGHIIREKGVFDLVEACSEIASVKELVLIGHYEDSVWHDLLKMSALRANCAWLKMPGELTHDKVLEFICKSDILVLPSYTEGFPMVIIEAMAMGCPVIATDVGAISEMLEAGGEHPCGVCVPVHDVEKLKDAISDLMADPVKRRTMGRNGAERVLNHYTFEKIAAQYKSLWTASVFNL